MRQITFNDIVNLNIPASVCYQWAADMIANKGKAILPSKISMKPADGVFCNVMPAILPEKFGGVKIVTRYPERIPSLDSKLLLFDSERGNFLALMDANWITAMRTGAVAAHSILLLAKKDFMKIGMIGLGNTARATLLVLAAMIPDRELQIKLLCYKGQEKLFQERFSEYPNFHFTYVENYRDLVKGSDVVISCVTYFDEDICTDDCFDEGVLVVPVHTRGFTNCDLFFDKVYADDCSHVKGFKNFKEFKYFSEICDVVNGSNVGRENDCERILTYNIGVAIHDVYFAVRIYELLKAEEGLAEIDLREPNEKFWL